MIRANNKATDFSNELVLAMCWKESSFDTEAEPNVGGNTSYGLMQLNNGALATVNANTPAGTHFEHADMADGAKAMAAGTYYLQIILDKFPNVSTVAEALDQYKGDGHNTYHVNLLAAEACLKTAKDDAARQKCLDQIHK
ncbi:MAG TPA: transglycosylase SLT domain-containing protein [Kofleriaceae bacterium]|nr:transglycosylase SLT domain-containing protein [Kofleriaceae bacterium]